MRGPLTLVISLVLIIAAVAQDDPMKGYAPGYVELLRESMRSFSHRDFATAVSIVEKAEQQYQATPMSINVRGAVAIEEKRFEEGRRLCIEALKQDPKFYPARFNLAEIPFVQGKYAEARNLFQKLQDEHPKDELLQFRVFLTYLLEKNEPAAAEALEQIPFLANSPIYYYSKAAWEFAHGNEKEGLSWVDRGNWVFPPAKTRNYADVFYDLGWLKRLDTQTAQKTSE